MLLVLGRGEEEQVEQVDVLHEDNAQLVEQYHKAFRNVGRKDFILAGRKDFEKGPQERFVDEQLVAGVTDQQLVQLQLFQ